MPKPTRSPASSTAVRYWSSSKLRAALLVSEAQIAGHEARTQLTCSIGVASSDSLNRWGEALVAQADAAVYAAKRLGRNRVQVAIALAA